MERLILSQISIANIQIATGTELLESLDAYWVFEPCIGKILELEREEPQAAYELFIDFNIIDQYDRIVRNAISNGDIIHDSVDRKESVPNENTDDMRSSTISKTELRERYSSHRLCQSLVEWRIYRLANDPVTRKIIPV